MQCDHIFCALWLKKGYGRNKGLGLAWDFQAYQIFMIFGGKKFIKENREFKFKGAIEKCISCFRVVLFFAIKGVTA